MFDAIKQIPVHMDYQGQKKAERIFQLVIMIFAVVGFGWGYIAQQFSYTVYSLGVGFIISSLIILPPWPIFRQDPIEWQKPVMDAATPGTATPKPTEPAAKNKKKTKAQ